MSLKAVSLYYSDIALGGTSDKEYHLRIVRLSDGGYAVHYQNGPRGGTMHDGTLTKQRSVSLIEAEGIYESKLREKLRGGYLPREAGTMPDPVPTVPAAAHWMRTPYPIEKLEELSSQPETNAFLNSALYWLQEKNDGDFLQVQKLDNGSYVGFNKKGGAITSLPFEVVADLQKIRAKTFFLVGELIGNRYITENLLELNGTDLRNETYRDRFDELEGLILAGSRHVTLTATWKTKAEKLEGRAALQNARKEGEVFKFIEAKYRPGDSGNHKKFKYTKTLSAIVVAKGFKGHNSATIALWSGNKLVEVGRVSLNGKPNVEVKDVVEVRYLYGTAGTRLYQPRLKIPNPVRKDVHAHECTVAQIIYKGGIEA